MKHLLLLIALLLFCLPVLAQDLTLEPAPAATVDAPVVVNIEAPDTVETPSSPVIEIHPLLQLILGLCAILVAVSYAFEKLGNRARQAVDNRFEMAALEKAGDGVPQPIVTQVTGALERTTTALLNLTEAWKKSTDRIPEESKPVPPTDQFTSTSSQ